MVGSQTDSDGPTIDLQRAATPAVSNRTAVAARAAAHDSADPPASPGSHSHNLNRHFFDFAAPEGASSPPRRNHNGGGFVAAEDKHAGRATALGAGAIANSFGAGYGHATAGGGLVGRPNPPGQLPAHSRRYPAVADANYHRFAARYGGGGSLPGRLNLPGPMSAHPGQQPAGADTYHSFGSGSGISLRARPSNVASSALESNLALLLAREGRPTEAATATGTAVVASARSGVQAAFLQDDHMNLDRRTSPRPGNPLLTRNRHTYSPSSSPEERLPPTSGMQARTGVGVGVGQHYYPQIMEQQQSHAARQPVVLSGSAPGKFLLPPISHVAEGRHGGIVHIAPSVPSIRTSTSGAHPHQKQQLPRRGASGTFGADKDGNDSMPVSAGAAQTRLSHSRSSYDIRQSASSPIPPLSSAPYYTDMMSYKRTIDATFQQRLAEAREATMKGLLRDQERMDRRMTAAQGGLRRQRIEKGAQQEGRGKDTCPRMTNEVRKNRRAQHIQATVDDLCEIVADLVLAETGLRRPNTAPALPGLPGGSVYDRPAVLAAVSSFLSDLPPRYALGVDRPSEVLVHMRLMAAARADSSKAAVHIGNVETGNIRAAPAAGPGWIGLDGCRLRLVTLCCVDCPRLLEFITKILGTGGARVLDADVMLTAGDSIALDRFVVEMRGRLRLDKLQQYIESFLEESRAVSTASDNLEAASRSVDSSDEVASAPKPKAADSGPALSRVSHKSAVAYGPLYFHPPKLETRRTSQLKLEQEMQSAVPFSQVLRSESNAFFGDAPHQAAARCFRRQNSAPPLNSGVTTRSFPAERDYANVGDANRETSFSSKGQSSGEDGSEGASSSRTLLLERSSCDASDEQQRQALVNRDATEFANTPEQGASFLLKDSQSILAVAETPQRVVPIIPFSELKIIGILGRGRISTIYKAAWQVGQVSGRVPTSDPVAMVALKVGTINPDTREIIGVEELQREVDIASILDHQNICSLVGVASDPDCLALAYEFCEEGSLLSLLSDTSRCYEYLPIALDIANGMAYLHSRQVIHRDLKPSNVLLTQNHRAKISDFGMSVANTGQELTAETGTYRWMAPEVIRHESYSSNADVYSFGIVLWQLITREIPFATMTPVQTAYAVAEGRRPEIPSSTPPELRRIIEACWDEDSHKRPSFTYIVMALADHAKMAFNPANVSAMTVSIANEMLANVQGNSTVNVDWSTPVVQSSSFFDRDRPHSSPGEGMFFQGPSSIGTGGGSTSVGNENDVGLQI